MGSQIAPNLPYQKNNPRRNAFRIQIDTISTLCQILQKSQLHAQLPDNFTLSFCHPRASIVSRFRLDLRRLPSRYYCARGINRQTSQYSYASPRLELPLRTHQCPFSACSPALAAHQAFCDVRKTARIAYDNRSEIFVGIWKLEGDIGDTSGKDDTTRLPLGTSLGQNKG
ncbi:hypothetical protein NA56DRAFT_705901 [Hyaloscypha hepaticicola]|uniref:Uncharacterized protein n=1 Tax=Hyaloscypha hepaticicola TaxID=2082293 RepID=A0A2J6PZ61_9HELO|nr:hypothetical protein NA56DRAFT_705901 [Hyaloscypha hepaticicola]